MKFAEDQPRHGETILHCGHLGGRRDRPARWFRYGSPVDFQRPDGTRGRAAWFAACEACFRRHGEEVARLPRGDGRWTGDAPVVEEPERS